MTESKQKAQQLVSRYWSAKVETPRVRESVISKELSIKCAIICVEEIMYEVKYMTPDIRYRFWQEVLTHLKEML